MKFHILFFIMASALLKSSPIAFAKEQATQQLGQTPQIQNTQSKQSQNQNPQNQTPLHYETLIQQKSPSMEELLQSSQLTASELQNHGSDMARTLSLLPSVTSTGSGQGGQSTSIFIQGSNSEHTQMYWNGFLLSDPSSGSGVFDNSLLEILFSSSAIHHVQLLSGPHGVEYGNGAMGGVLLLSSDDSNISEGRVAFKLSTRSSHTEVYSGGVQPASSNSKTRIHWTLANGRSEGPSAAAATSVDKNSASNSATGKTEKELTQNMESDFQEQHLGLLDYRYSGWGEPLQARSMLLFSEVRNGFDRGAGLASDDPNAEARKKLFQLGLGLDYQWTQEQALQASVSWISSDRRDQNAIDAQSTDVQTTKYLGQSQKTEIDWLYKTNFDTIRFDNKLGVEIIRDQSDITEDYGYGESVLNRSKTLTAIFTKPTWTLRTGDVTQAFSLGTRQQCVSGDSCQQVFESQWGLQRELQRGLQQNTLGFFVRWSQAVKEPTLFQKYSQIYGNENLTTEKVTGYSMGLQWGLQTLRFFQNKYQDLIQYNYSTNRYGSIGQARTQGIELDLQDKQMWWDWRFQWTYLESQDLDTKLELLRRPHHQGHLLLDFPSKVFHDTGWAYFADLGYKSATMDVAFVNGNSERVTLPSYKTLSLGVKKHLQPNWICQVRWSQALSDYLNPTPATDVWGYSGPQEQFWLELVYN